MGVTFDGSINLGQIITAVVFLGGMIMFIGGMRERMSTVSEAIVEMKKDIKELAKVTVELAAAKARDDGLDQRITRLEQNADLVREAQALRSVVQVRESQERIERRD